MDTMKKEKKEKRSILPGVIIASLLVAVVVYAVLLNAEKTVLSDYEKGLVYVTTKPVPKGTLVTADYVTQKEVDKSLIPSGAVNPEDLTGLISVYAVDQGSIITTGMFTAVNDITKDMTQPVVAGFKADDLYQVVGGVLRSGDRINIYQVNENANKGDTSQSLANTDDNWTEASSDTEAASLVWGNVFVQEVFDSAGAVISTSDTTTPAQRVNIYMDNDNVAAFYAALAQGSLRVVKICD